MTVTGKIQKYRLRELAVERLGPAEPHEGTPTA